MMTGTQFCSMFYFFFTTLYSGNHELSRSNCNFNDYIWQIIGIFSACVLPYYIVLKNILCTARWFDLHTLWNDYHNKFSECPSSLIDTKLKRKIVSFEMRTLKIYSLNNFHIWHTVVLIIIIMWYVTFLVLIMGSLYPLYLHPILLPPSPPLVTIYLISFSMSLFVFEV